MVIKAYGYVSCGRSIDYQINSDNASLEWVLNSASYCRLNLCVTLFRDVTEVQVWLVYVITLSCSFIY